MLKKIDLETEATAEKEDVNKNILTEEEGERDRTLLTLVRL